MADLWFRLAVNFPRHPKVVQAGAAAAWLAVCAMAYSREHLTDGLIPAAVVPTLAAVKKPLALADRLVEVGLWHKTDTGYEIHDFLTWNPSRAEVEEMREWGTSRKALYRDKALTAFIRQRDNNQCRYCGIDVNWSDRRGPAGGQFDHVIPRGPGTAENVVVACRECNIRKNNKTLAECGLSLRPEPIPNQVGTSSGINAPYVRADAPAPDAHSASVSSLPMVEVLEGGAGETTDDPPVWRQRGRTAPLLPGPISHAQCYPSPGCERGLCVPRFVTKDWLGQFSGDSKAVDEFIANTLRFTPAGPQGDPVKWWRAKWDEKYRAPIGGKPAMTLRTPGQLAQDEIHRRLRATKESA